MSDNAYKGVVSAVYEKPWTDRDSGDEIILRSFQIEGEKRYFRTGTFQVRAIVEGAYISFTADAKSGNVDTKSVSVVEGEAPARAPKPASGGRTGTKSAPAASRDSYWADKEKRDIEVREPTIAYSAAQKNATTIVAAALAADALSFGQAAKGKKLDMLVDYIEQTTLRLAQLQRDGAAILKAGVVVEKVIDDE